MNLLRNKRVRQHFGEIHKYLFYFVKCLFVIRNPLTFLRAYVSLTNLPGNLVQFRNGLTIQLSEHPHDVVSVFLVFIRQDYGKVPAHSVVVDIGANVGIFAIYALQNGASCVYAYEPSQEAFEILQKNARNQPFTGKIIAHSAAVTNQDNQWVKFPSRASVYNQILPDQTTVPYETVPTLRLQTALSQAPNVNFLKLDCEGAEYSLLLEDDTPLLQSLSEIRMEYHYGRVPELTAKLQTQGFQVLRHHSDTPLLGNIWYTHRTQPSP
jgi:FkbM family methyltransferase